MKGRSKFRITTTNHPDPATSQIAVSVRKARAIRQARAMAVDNGNVMLWAENPVTRQWYRISLRPAEWPDSLTSANKGGALTNNIQVGFIPSAVRVLGRRDK